MTKKQKSAVRAALWRYQQVQAQGGEVMMRRGVGKGWEAKWRAAIDEAMRVDAHGEVLRLRYVEGLTENEVIALLHIGRTTYKNWYSEALSTLAVLAAGQGLL